MRNFKDTLDEIIQKTHPHNFTNCFLVPLGTTYLSMYLKNNSVLKNTKKQKILKKYKKRQRKDKKTKQKDNLNLEIKKKLIIFK
jgi:hypothetical protein